MCFWTQGLWEAEGEGLGILKHWVLSQSKVS